MRLPYPISKLLMAVGLGSAGLALVAWAWPHWLRTQNVLPSHSFQLQSGQMGEWKAYGGSWEILDDAVQSNSYERGAKLLAGSSHWSDYTLNADMRFEGVAADMGVTVRSNDESEGVDSYNGYFVGLRSLDGTLVIGHSNYAWVEALPVTVPGGVRPFVWYRLRVTAVGCNIAASAQNLTTLQTAWIAYEDNSCVRSGRIGLRSLNANAQWRNISVVPARWDDYVGLERNAASVEHPVIMDGPPWWTPWHVGVLFASALAVALLAQLAFFRIQQWKAYTIVQERERLAHEIHDTMAQGFAGIGYQIQGIRRSLLRSDPQDSNHTGDQLRVAYQLVRRCHAEASRTIAMFGSSSPQIQDNLLGRLAETAHRIAGDQIRTNTKLHGSSTLLPLHIADALLHIGQEAIANAVSHSDPTVLKITLSYEGENVELVVEDNGQGFEYKPDKAGFGILGMQKRTRDIAGALHIFSTPGNGTRVQVSASLHKENLRTRLFAIVRARFASTPTDFSAS